MFSSCRCKNTLGEGSLAPYEADPDLLAIWSAVKQFFVDFSTIIADAYFFILKGLSNKSLCVHTNLSSEFYSALMLQCKFIGTRVTADRNVEVNVNADNLKDFLSQYGLHGPDSLRCSELDKGWVKVSEINEKYADDDTSDDVRHYDEGLWITHWEV
jgi:hypothetical protein